MVTWRALAGVLGAVVAAVAAFYWVEGAVILGLTVTYLTSQRVTSLCVTILRAAGRKKFTASSAAYTDRKSVV